MERFDALRIGRPRTPGWFGQARARADRARCGAEMRPVGLSEPTVLPTIPDPSAYTPVSHHVCQSVVVVGWAGTNVGYLGPPR